MSKVREDKNLIVGLDIGTSKIVAIVAELLPEGSIKVIGLGQHISRGLKKGWSSILIPPCKPSNGRLKKPS